MPWESQGAALCSFGWLVVHTGAHSSPLQYLARGARAAYLLGLWSEAVGLFEQALGVNANCPPAVQGLRLTKRMRAHCERAAVAFADGRFAECAMELRPVVVECPGALDVQLRIAQCDVEAGNIDDARKLARCGSWRMLVCWVVLASARVTCPVLVCVVARTESALSWMPPCVRGRCAPYPFLCCPCVTWLVPHLSFPPFSRSGRSVLRDQPRHVGAMYTLAVAAHHSDDHVTVQRLLGRAVRLAPDNALCVRLLKLSRRVQRAKTEGNEAFKRRDFAAAIQSYTGVLVMEGVGVKTRARILNNRAMCASRSGDASQAKTDFSAAIDLDDTYVKVRVCCCSVVASL